MQAMLSELSRRVQLACWQAASVADMLRTLLETSSVLEEDTQLQL